VAHEEELTSGSMRTGMEVKERKVASAAEETQARRK
jgi:hypothetical protein